MVPGPPATSGGSKGILVFVLVQVEVSTRPHLGLVTFSSTLFLV